MDIAKHTDLAFSQDNEARFQKMLPHYPDREAALIPTLHMALRQFGALSEEVVHFVAGKLSLPPSKVLAVISFYTMLHREEKGRYNIQVCRTLSCALAGADEVIAHLEKKLGIKQERPRRMESSPSRRSSAWPPAGVRQCFRSTSTSMTRTLPSRR